MIRRLSHCKDILTSSFTKGCASIFKSPFNHRQKLHSNDLCLLNKDGNKMKKQINLRWACLCLALLLCLLSVPLPGTAHALAAKQTTAETASKKQSSDTTVSASNNQTSGTATYASNNQTSGAKKATTPKNILKKEKGKLYYYNGKGKRIQNCWKTIKKKRYYFQADGSAAVGCVKIGKTRYLFSKKGVLLKNGFHKVLGKTYYADSKGIAATGWRTIGSNRYHFLKNGVMQTGWYHVGAKSWYFSKKNGAMLTGWHKISNKSYYFGSDGKLAKDTWIGTQYVDKSGVCVPSKKSKLLSLKTKLNSTLRSYSGSWSVYVKNLDTNESFSINNHPVYAASLIKLYALGAAYEQIGQKKFSESSVKDTLNSMITVSSNDAFNTTVRKIGTTYINTWCRANGYNDTTQCHGLSPSGNNYGLRTSSGSNKTSVEDCGKFLESVYRGTCVSSSASSKMLSMLKRQTRRSKIPAGVPSGVTVANKTGETDDYTHDAAIVYSKGADYILCVMGYAPGNAWSAASRIPTISRTVYNFFN